MKILDYTISVVAIVYQSIKKHKFSKYMFVLALVCLWGIIDHGESITECGDIYEGNNISLGFWWSVVVTAFVAIFFKEVLDTKK